MEIKGKSVLTRLASLGAAIWLGAQLGFGYVAAPVLFRYLPKMEAGNIAGELFHIVAYVGLSVWLLVWVSIMRQGGKIVYWVSGLLVLLAINEFVVTPVIEAHKAGSTNWLLSLVGGSFGIWHGISSMIYLLCGILGTVLFWRLNRFDGK